MKRRETRFSKKKKKGWAGGLIEAHKQIREKKKKQLLLCWMREDDAVAFVMDAYREHFASARKHGLKLVEIERTIAIKVHVG